MVRTLFNGIQRSEKWFSMFEVQKICLLCNSLIYKSLVIAIAEVLLTGKDKKTFLSFIIIR